MSLSFHLRKTFSAQRLLNETHWKNCPNCPSPHLQRKKSNIKPYTHVCYIAIIWQITISFLIIIYWIWEFHCCYQIPKKPNATHCTQLLLTYTTACQDWAASWTRICPPEEKTWQRNFLTHLPLAHKCPHFLELSWIPLSETWPSLWSPGWFHSIKSINWYGIYTFCSVSSEILYMMLKLVLHSIISHEDNHILWVPSKTARSL